MQAKPKRSRNAQWTKRTVEAGKCRICLQAREPERLDRQTCVACGKRLSKRSSAQFRVRRQEAIAKGWCAVCREREPVPGTLYCGACAETHTEAARRHRIRNREKGICTRCSTPLSCEERAQGFTHCAYHRQKNRAYKTVHQQRPAAA